MVGMIMLHKNRLLLRCKQESATTSKPYTKKQGEVIILPLLGKYQVTHEKLLKANIYRPTMQTEHPPTITNRR